MAQKSWHQIYKDELRLGDRIADKITDFVGSWSFIVIHVVWFAAWIVMPVEPFPFGLLTMVVSLEAIFISTFIMISQNRQTERDRRRADADFETNVTAKKEIEQLQIRLARIEDEKLEQVLKLLRSDK